MLGLLSRNGIPRTAFGIASAAGEVLGHAASTMATPTSDTFGALPRAIFCGIGIPNDETARAYLRNAAFQR